MRLSIAKNLRHATFIKLPIFIRGLVTRRNSISDWVKRRSDIVVLNQWVAAINKNLFWLHRMGPTRDSVHFSNSERFVSKPHSEQQSSRRSGGPTRSLLSCSWNAGTHLMPLQTICNSPVKMVHSFGVFGNGSNNSVMATARYFW